MKNKLKLSLTLLFLTFFRRWYLLLAAIGLSVAGAFGVPFCSLLAGLLWILLVILWLATIVPTLLLMNNDESGEFDKVLDQIMEDPQEFISEKAEEQEHRMNLHGEQLLFLSDEDLYETVYFQNCELDGEDECAPQNFSGARQTFFVVSTFDTEVQNGGLCQFFVNSSRAAAPLVSACLEQIGATEHRALYDTFIQNNSIDVHDLSSFMVHSHRGYIKQTKRYPFDPFDEAYYELPPLQDKLAAYVRTHIEEF